jgi:ubiquinone biosynthesis protein COQ9
MRWLLDAAGVATGGLTGQLRVQGLLAIWLRGLRAWQGDESGDLSTTMAAVDKGLDQALRAEGWLPFRPGSAGEAAEVFEKADDAGAAQAAASEPPLPPSDSPPAASSGTSPIVM